MTAVRHNNAAYIRRFRRAHDELSQITEQPKNLYRFLGLTNRSSSGSLSKKAAELVARYRPTNKEVQRNLAGLAQTIFETAEQKAAYDQWLKEQSDLQPILDGAIRIY